MGVNAFIRLFLTLEKQQPAPTRPHLMKYLITIRTISADLTCFISPVTPGFMVVTFNTKHCHSSCFVFLLFCFFNTHLDLSPESFKQQSVTLKAGLEITVSNQDA